MRYRHFLYHRWRRSYYPILMQDGIPFHCRFPEASVRSNPSVQGGLGYPRSCWPASSLEVGLKLSSFFIGSSIHSFVCICCDAPGSNVVEDILRSSPLSLGFPSSYLDLGPRRLGQPKSAWRSGDRSGPSSSKCGLRGSWVLWGKKPRL